MELLQLSSETMDELIWFQHGILQSQMDPTGTISTHSLLRTTDQRTVKMRHMLWSVYVYTQSISFPFYYGI